MAPLLPLTLAFIAGVSLPVGLTLALVALLLMASRLRRSSAWAQIALFMVGGIVAATARSAFESDLPEPTRGVFEGEVVALSLAGERAFVTFEPSTFPGLGLRVAMDLPGPEWGEGARVYFVGDLRRPDPADVQGQMDLREWSTTRRIGFVGVGRLFLRREAPWFSSLIVAARLACKDALDAQAEVEGAAILRGLLLGDPRGLSAATARAFEDTGTGHLLSVSGVHVAGLATIVYLLVTWVCRRLGLGRASLYGALFAVPAAFAFVLLSQFPLAGVRAATMTAVALLARASGRPTVGANLLALSALVVCLEDPHVIHEPAFQLSFIAVAALVLEPRVRGLAGLLWCSVVVSAATAGVQCAWFGTFAPSGAVANLLLIPAASVVLVPLGALGLVVSAVTPLPLWVASHLALLFVAFAETLASLLGGLWVVGCAGAPLLGLPFVALWGFRWFKVVGLAVPTLVALGLSIYTWPPSSSVDFVAVGQGDAILIRSEGRAALVDVGPDLGARAVRAHLRAVGVSRLDWVLLTHGHADHVAGLQAILGSTSVGLVLARPRRVFDRHWSPVRRALSPTGHTLSETERMPTSLGSFQLDLEPPLASPKTENDASVVLTVSGAAHRLLLTGDLGPEAELALLRRPRATIAALKAPHHGSGKSATKALLDALRPRLVVVTAGRHNRFEFPRPDMVRRVLESGASLNGTHAQGTLRLTLDEGLELTSTVGVPIAQETRLRDDGSDR